MNDARVRWITVVLLAAVGLLGKVLGPIGLLGLVATKVWPFETMILCLTNDFIWWIPFSIYLRDAWPFARRDWLAD